MWQILLDPYHFNKGGEEALSPQEAMWHEGKNQNRNPENKNAGAGSGARPGKNPVAA
jgi:hypothetical protein